MNDKDKEAYDKWLKAQNYDYDSWDDKHYQNGLVVSIYSETEEAWQAALEHERERSKLLIEALEFYANSTRLILEVKDLPIDPVLGRSVISSKSIMDNGDRARFALNKYRESSNDDTKSHRSKK